MQKQNDFTASHLKCLPDHNRTRILLANVINAQKTCFDINNNGLRDEE